MLTPTGRRRHMTDTAGQARSARATIRDVAREAGVSTSTVSRVLDERLPPSRNQTADRVRQVAARLGSRHDYRDSALRRQQSGTNGVLVPRQPDTELATQVGPESCTDSVVQEGELKDGAKLL